MPMTRRKKKKEPGLSKKYDTALTGVGKEPIFVDQLFMTDLDRKMVKIQTFNWYAYMFDIRKDFTKDLMAEARARAWPRQLVSEIRGVNLSYLSASSLKLVRMKSNGWVLDKYEDTAISLLMDKLLRLCETSLNERKRQQRLEVKTVYKSAPSSPLVNELEQLEDSWCEAEISVFNLYKRARELNVSKGQIKSEIKNWVDDRLSEMILLEKGDRDVKEGYSRYSNKFLKYMTSHLREMSEDIERLLYQPKKTKAPRAKKIIPIEKIVSNVKYKSNDDELKIASINPMKIVGASKVILFNTKYRTLQVYVTDNHLGLSIKGTTLCGWSSELTYGTKIRKPNEFFSNILGTNSQNKIDKFINALTTKRFTPNGRINKDTLIVKVFT